MAEEGVIINFREQGINQLIAQQKRLQNEINNFNKGGQRLARQQKQVNRLMTGGAQKLIDNSTAVNKVAKQYDSFSGVMGMGLTNWRKFNDQGGEFSTIGARAANRFRLMTHGLRGFRMEMLGVMFFGMGLAMFFTGLLKPALQLVGIFELWSQTLAILFLPIALILLELFLPIMEFFISLPAPMQIAIGLFVILAAIFFKLVFLFGMFALGVGSLIQAFGGWVVIQPIIAAFGAAITASLAVVLIVLAIVVIAIIGFALAWKENFGNIKGWVKLMWIGIKQTFTGIWQFIKSVWMIISGLFSGNTEKIIEGFKLMWVAIKNIFTGLLRFVGGLLVTLGLSILRALWGAVVSIGGLLVKAYGYLKEKVSGFVGGAVGKIKGGRQTGGFIPHTGLYKLHAGETVNQAGDTINSSPIINVYGATSEDLVSQISEAVTRNLANLSRR